MKKESEFEIEYSEYALEFLKKTDRQLKEGIVQLNQRQSLDNKKPLPGLI